MKTTYLPQRKNQHGAALIVALVLLLVLTVLSISSMNSASLELIMTGNEQFHTNAQQAALTGNEVVLRTIRPTPSAPSTTLALDGIVKGGILPTLTVTNQEVAATGDTYSSTTTFLGEGAPPEGTELGTNTTLYYRIDTRATSARGARSHIVQTLGLTAPK
jgi:type IV pilus assembly protein PilX